jgi:hypothetical protein
MFTGMNVITSCNVLWDTHECWPVNGLIMIDVMQWRGKEDE